MIIVLGGSGYIGSAVVRALDQAGEDVVSLSRAQCDYYDRHELLSAISSARFLINAAGYTGQPNVDACEEHKTECLQANAVLPGIIREVCEAVRLPWLHVSSGCIYSGTRADRSGFKESDPPNFCFRTNNCSFYSGSKALGEELLDGASDCYVLRLRIPFEARDHRRNYLSKLLRYDTLLDAENSLTWLDSFTASCLYCVRARPQPGVYNLTNPGFVTTREVTELIQSIGLTEKAFRFFDSEAEFMEQAARTPRSNCILDSSKAVNAGFPLVDVHRALEQALCRWQPSPVTLPS